MSDQRSGTALKSLRERGHREIEVYEAERKAGIARNIANGQPNVRLGQHWNEAMLARITEVLVAREALGA